MKRCLLLMLCLLLALPCALGEDTEYDEDEEELGLQRYDYTVENHTLIIPEGVTSMGYWYDEQGELIDGDWRGLDGNEYIDEDILDFRLPSTLKRIGEYGILCWYYLDEIIIPEGVEILDDSCFYGVSAKRLVLPSTLRVMDAASLNEATFEQIIISPDNPYYMERDGLILSRDGRTLVYSYTDAAHVTVPAGVKEIADGAFAGLDALQSVSLPIGLTHIGQSVFEGCGRLTHLNVPLTVLCIGRGAFSNCVSLQSVTLPQKFAALLSDDQQARDALNAQYPAIYEDDEPYCDTVFDNCPALFAAFTGDNAETMNTQYDPATHTIYDDRDMLTLVVLPEDGGDQANAYLSPDGEAVCTLAAGTVLYTTKEHTWQEYLSGTLSRYAVVQAARVSSYKTLLISWADVMSISDLPVLFSFSVDGLMGELTIQKNGGNQEIITFDASQANLAYTADDANRPALAISGDYDGKTFAGVLFIGNLVLSRRYTGDDKTYGILLASKKSLPIFVYDKPDGARIARYYSGVQIEVLDTSDAWARVLVNGQEAYVPGENVRIVPQSPPPQKGGE